MINRRRAFPFFFIILALAIPCARQASSDEELVDKIAVIVNCEIITQGEIDRFTEPIYREYQTLYADDELSARLDEARANIVNQLIDDRLILGEAKRLKIEVDEREVDSRIEDAKKRFESSEQFEKALAEQKVTLSDLRLRYAEQMMTRRLIDQKVGSKITITPVEISEYYNKHMDEYAQSEEAKVRNILIRPKADAAAGEALDLAKEILRRLEEGGDFALLAKEYSEGPYAAEGGLMGYVKRGDLLPELEAVVFDMKEGEISGIVQTSLGYHILKLEERRAERPRDLSEMRHEVEEAIFRDKVKDKIKEWVQGLRKNAYIAFK